MEKYKKKCFTHALINPPKKKKILKNVYKKDKTGVVVFYLTFLFL